MRLLPTRLLLAAAFALPSLAGAVTESSGQASFEAEDWTSNIGRTIASVPYAWVAASDVSGFSGTGFAVAVPSDATTVASGWTTSSPELRYTVNFTNTGTYYVWLRGYAQTQETLSAYIGIDGASPASARIDLPVMGAWSWGNTASGSSVPVAVTVSSAGAHTINIWMRDAGFALDRIVLTRNPNYSPSYSADFWRGQSIYQIVTDRFFDGDASNNSALPNYGPSNGGQAHGGDFKGIEQKLDYIKALGATAIWISPVAKNANGDYHGYAATDFYAVNPRMGTLSDLQRLVSEAHRRGLLVINDVVVNHASTWVDSAQAGWGTTFLYSPQGYTLRYNSGGASYAAPFDNASLQSAFGNTALTNIFHNNCGSIPNYGDPVQVEMGELASLDDFRTESAYVRQAMKDIWSYWISAAGFDAYRIDTVKHVEMGFWDSWAPAVRAAASASDKPNFFLFGEVYDGSDAKVGSYTGAKTTGVYKLDSAIDYPLYYAIKSVFASASGSTGQIESRYGNLNTNNYDPAALDSLVLNLDNHDQPRFLSTASGGTAARLEVALAFLYTSRGIPSLYYGTEQDFDGGSDPWCREDMFDGQFEGGPSLGDNFNMASARFKLVAKLNNLRRLYPALRTGTHNSLWSDWAAPGLFAYARRLGGQEAYVILNTSGSAQTIAARPSIHPSGTVLVNVFNPSETVTTTNGPAADGIPPIAMPSMSYKVFVAQSQWRALDPVVESVSPAHDAGSIPTASPVVLTFSRGMNTNSVQSALATTPATTGTFAWSKTNTVLTYTPSGNLSGSTLYSVRVDASAADTNGLALFAPFESRFTTAAASGASAPAVNSTTVSNITDTAAALSASVNPNGASTSVSFEYGATSSYGSATAPQPAGSGTSSTNVAVALNGLLPGAAYHYRAVASNSAGTTYGPDGTFTTTSSTLKPTVLSKPATFVTTVSGNLNADVNPNGNETSVYFAYGVQPGALTNTTATNSVGGGTGVVGVWAYAWPLEPDTTYYYEAVAVSGSDLIRGAVQSFSTLPVKPAVTTLAAANVSTNSATLRGTANPSGSATSSWFEYGPTADYGTASPATAIGGGTNDVATTAELSGLDGSQVYHYRAVASNSFGVTYGLDTSFTTAAPAPEVTTGAPGPVSSNSATLTGSVDPNGLTAEYWIEYGTNGTLGLTTQRGASDDAESYASFGYASPGNNGGSGFGAFTNYSKTSATRGGTFLASGLDGSKAFGIWAGSAVQSARRAISEPRKVGRFSFSARFDVANTKGFTGLNLKSQAGTTFGSGELVSVGIVPASGTIGGNNGLLVTDLAGQRMLSLGTNDIRGSGTAPIVDVRLDFDTISGAYTLGARVRGSEYAYLSGALKTSGTNVTASAIGFQNAESGSSYQNLIFDNLAVGGADSLAATNVAVPVSSAVTGLSAGAIYSYRLAGANAAGTNYGAVKTFVTGPDLAVEKWGAGPFIPGGQVVFLVTVTNAGALPSAGPVTVAELPPPGMSVTSMSGEGWVFNATNLTCTTTNTVASGAAYPAISVTCALSTNAVGAMTNSVSVSGGGDANSANNSAASAFRVDPSGIAAWRMQHFGTSESTGTAADSANPSGDGLANLFKYAMGLSPTNAAPEADRPTLTTAGGKLALRFRRARDAQGVTITVEAAGGLGGIWPETIWTSGADPFAGTNSYEWKTVEDVLPMTEAPAGQRFLRLRVTSP